MSSDPATQGRGFTRFAYACQFFYGGWFLFHGLNYWFQFYPDRSIRPGPGLIPALVDAGVMEVVKVLEVILGLALLADVFVALAIVACWPLTLMIAFVNASHLKPFGIAVAAIIIGMNLVMSLGHLDRYRPMLALHAGSPSLVSLRGGVGGDSARLSTAIHVIGAVLGTVAAVLVTFWSLRR